MSPARRTGNGIAGFPLAGGVAVGGGGFVFAGVDHALKVDDNGAANGISRGFAKDLGFGLVPVFDVVAFDGSALLVESQWRGGGWPLAFQESSSRNPAPYQNRLAILRIR